MISSDYKSMYKMHTTPTSSSPDMLPPLEKQLLHEYRELVADIELEITRISEALPKNILQCRKGCSECCIEFSVFPLEAVVLISHMKGPVIDTITPPQRCVFLQQDCCSTYEARPILCRTQGIPIGYLKDEESSIEVSACPVNFQEKFRFSEEGILFMDRFNYRLAELNQRYCEAAGLDPQQRIILSDLLSEIRKKRQQ